MIYKVILESRKMGGFCKSCIQRFTYEIEADSAEVAIKNAKVKTSLDLDYYKINVIYVRSIS